jgi:hypothetical protein
MMAGNRLLIELLPARILFDGAGWTTFEVEDPTKPGGFANVSIPLVIENQPLASDPRLSRRVLKIAGTPQSDVFQLSTTKRVIQDFPAENHVAFGYGGRLEVATHDLLALPPEHLPHGWRNGLEQWFDMHSYNNTEPVITGMYLNTRFYIPWQTDLIIADTGGGDDVIDIDPAIKVKTIVAAGRGDDTVFGGGGYAYISGGDGADKLYARGTSSDLFGNAGSDQLVGGWGIDRLNGGGGNDRLSGGALPSFAKEDLIVGGQGVDRAVPDDGDQFESIESFF